MAALCDAARHPYMRAEGGGMILNISSRVSKNYFPNLSAYASTKYALNALSLTAREELKKDNIIVSVFHPKMTATNFGKNSVGAITGDARAAERARANGMEVDTAGTGGGESYWNRSGPEADVDAKQMVIIELQCLLMT